MIVDLAIDTNGQIAVMLAQGSSPATTLHVCTDELGSPWHAAVWRKEDGLQLDLRRIWYARHDAVDGRVAL